MIEISENFSLKEYNTFGIDVTCKYFVKCDQESELLEFVGSYALDPEEILLLGGVMAVKLCRISTDDASNVVKIQFNVSSFSPGL